jgi:hypothetical protein
LCRRTVRRTSGQRPVRALIALWRASRLDAMPGSIPSAPIKSSLVAGGGPGRAPGRRIGLGIRDSRGSGAEPSLATVSRFRAGSPTRPPTPEGVGGLTDPRRDAYQGGACRRRAAPTAGPCHREPRAGQMTNLLSRKCAGYRRDVMLSRLLSKPDLWARPSGRAAPIARPVAFKTHGRLATPRELGLELMGCPQPRFRITSNSRSICSPGSAADRRKLGLHIRPVAPVR